VLALRVELDADRPPELPRDELRGFFSGSGSRQIGQFWMKRLWRQKVGTLAHPL
jgi:hypothetical protein